MGRIRVRGRAEKAVEYDRVELRIRFHTEDTDELVVNRTIEQELERLLSALAELGIPAGELKVESEQTHPATRDDRPIVVGEKVLTIERDLVRSELNALIEAVTENAPSAHHSTEYSYSDPAALELDLIAAAVADAHVKAQAAARALGEELGPVHEIDMERSGYWPMPRGENIAMSAMAMEDRAPKQADELGADEARFEKELTVAWCVGDTKDGDC